MILEAFGKLSVAQSLTAGTTISTNVINIGALCAGGLNLSDAWIDIETRVVLGTVNTVTIDLVISSAANLATAPVKIISVVMAATDKRLLTVGKHILRCTLPYEVASLARDLGATFLYIGLSYVIGGSATLTVNAAISPSRPASDYYEQITDSNVGVPA